LSSEEYIYTLGRLLGDALDIMSSQIGIISSLESFADIPFMVRFHTPILDESR
jgi:hypothetical protein